MKGRLPCRLQPLVEECTAVGAAENPELRSQPPVPLKADSVSPYFLISGVRILVNSDAL